jgi:beta-lactamase superfamily II metal-dependent hydrolase
MPIPPTGRHTLRLCFSLGLSLVVLLSPSISAADSGGQLRIVHLDAGQGDAAVLISPEGQVAMFDDGGASYPTFPCSEILAQLNSLGITHVDYHFTSHYHGDHIGCFAAIDNVVHFSQGWDRGGSYGSSAYTAYASQLGSRRRTLTKGKMFTLDSLSTHPVTITCIDFNATGNDDYENSKSVVLRVNFGSFSEVLGGDLTGVTGTGRYDRETAFGPEVDTVMVYKVHHHSSRYSSNDAWLNAIAPKAAIISLGDDNPYGFATSDVLTRLHNHHVKTYWTEGGAGTAPNAAWDKVASGPITIRAAWEAGGKTVISGGYGGSAFSDTLINPAMPVGACCGQPGLCACITQDDCIAEEGVWRGVGTSCNPDYCAASDVSPVAQPSWAGLNGAAPNPFSDATALRYRLEEASSVRLEIFDAAGRRIRSFDAGRMPQGAHTLSWDGRNAAGDPVGPGVYFARLLAAGRVWSQPLVRLR